MSKRTAVLFTVVLAGLLFPLLAAAQQEAPTYTFVAEWTVPRALWAEWTAYGEKNAKPVYEKLLADGTITGWGTYATIVHEEDGNTHGSWFTAGSIANIEKALGELQKISTTGVMASAGIKHHDYLVRGRYRKAKSGSGTSGYLWVSANKLQPGKYQDWRKLFDKYVRSTLDGLVDSGALMSFEIETEQVHTQDPGWVFVVLTSSSADGLDKFFAAVNALGEKRSEEENRAIAAAFADVTTAGTHRDYYARLSGYASK